MTGGQLDEQKKEWIEEEHAGMSHEQNSWGILPGQESNLWPRAQIHGSAYRQILCLQSPFSACRASCVSEECLVTCEVRTLTNQNSSPTCEIRLP